MLRFVEIELVLCCIQQVHIAVIAVSVNEVTSRVGENIQAMVMALGDKENPNLEVNPQISLPRTFLL